MPTKEIENHLTANFRLKKRQIMVANFLGGLAWGFGTVIGATVIVALLLGILRALGYVPLIGALVSDVTDNLNLRRTPVTTYEEERPTPPPVPTYYIIPAPTPTPSPESSSSATPKP